MLAGQRLQHVGKIPGKAGHVEQPGVAARLFQPLAQCVT